MSDPDAEQRLQHPAFGRMAIHRIHGRTNLFMVDYPQDHFLRIRISTAELSRRGANDYVHAQREIIEVALSSVQFANLLTSTNTEGVPCTLLQYRDPKTGDFLAPTLPDKHGATQETYVEDIEARAKLTAENVKSALSEVERLLKEPGSIRKGDLQSLKDKLYHANMSLADNLPYVVEKAAEAIETATMNAKSEINAHIEHVLVKLGERALGDRLSAAIEAGAVDAKEIGRSVIEAVATLEAPDAAPS